MKTVTLIRHAQSKFNAGEIKSEQDLINCKLSANGINQATTINGSFNLLILSPLKRAIQTYTYSNIHTEDIIISHLFREQRENTPLNYLENESISPENDVQMKERVMVAVQYLKSCKPTNIGVITHAHFIYYFMKHFNIQPFILENGKSITFNI